MGQVEVREKDLLQVDGTHREGDSDGFPEGKSLVFF